MSWMQQAVRDFMLATGQPAPDKLDLDGVRLQLRAELILEEAKETVEAMGFMLYVSNNELCIRRIADPDWPDVIDGLCDLIYVTLGCAVEAGFSLSPFFAEVHRSNMTKVGGPIRADGKLLKPQGWEPPRIKWLFDRLVERGRCIGRTT